MQQEEENALIMGFKKKYCSVTICTIGTIGCVLLETGQLCCDINISSLGVAEYNLGQTASSITSICHSNIMILGGAF